jgi:cyclopropane fatty-acyl-phospholipid synthase-like methyltransferase
MKPYAESCDQNREPILAVIKPLLAGSSSVLEIGSGTGQHAVFFARNMPRLVWHTSDCVQYHNGIKQWLQEAMLDNIRAPITLDVATSKWPQQTFDAVFSANTVHIMHWHEIEAMFSGVADVLKGGGKFLLYGPFNFNGRYTSESNARFDRMLKDRDPDSGIRNFEDLDRLAQQGGLRLRNDVQMPANNRILYWEKVQPHWGNM